MLSQRTFLWTVTLFFALVCLASAQEKQQEKKAKQAPPKPPEGTTVLRDLEYVSKGHERHKLDLYLPKEQNGLFRKERVSSPGRHEHAWRTTISP